MTPVPFISSRNTMLPLEGILFAPSLIVTPLAVAALFLWRKRGSNYPRYWRSALIVCFVLCALFLIQVLNAPLYSERDHSPDNPDGFSSGMRGVIGVVLL